MNGWDRVRMGVLYEEVAKLRAELDQLRAELNELRNELRNRAALDDKVRLPCGEAASGTGRAS